MRKAVGSEDGRLDGLLFLSTDSGHSHGRRRLVLRARGRSDVLEVGLVLFELRAEVAAGEADASSILVSSARLLISSNSLVVIPDRLEHTLQTPRLDRHLLLHVPKMHQLRRHLLLHQLEVVPRVDDLELLELPEHLLDLDPLPNEHCVLSRRRSLGEVGEIDRTTVGKLRDGSDELDKDRLRLLKENVVFGDVVVRHELRGDVLDRRLPAREDREVDGSVLLPWDLGRSGSEFGETETEVMLVARGLREANGGSVCARDGSSHESGSREYRCA